VEIDAGNTGSLAVWGWACGTFLPLSGTKQIWERLYLNGVFMCYLPSYSWIFIRLGQIFYLFFWWYLHLIIIYYYYLYIKHGVVIIINLSLHE